MPTNIQRQFVDKFSAFTLLTECTAENNAKFEKLISEYYAYNTLVKLVKWEQDEYKRNFCFEQWKAGVLEKFDLVDSRLNFNPLRY